MSVMTLGLDLSITSTGICVVEAHDEGDIDVVDTQCIETDSDMDWIDRVNYIESTILDGLSLYPISKTIYLENYSFGGGYRNTIVYELGGIIKKRILQEGYEIILIPPTSAKKFATGRGRAPKRPENEPKSTWSKKWMMTKVKENFGYEFETDDETDAFVIALIGAKTELAKNNSSFLDNMEDYHQQLISSLLEEASINE